MQYTAINIQQRPVNTPQPETVFPRYALPVSLFKVQESVDIVNCSCTIISHCIFQNLQKMGMLCHKIYNFFPKKSFFLFNYKKLLVSFELTRGHKLTSVSIYESDLARFFPASFPRHFLWFTFGPASFTCLVLLPFSLQSNRSSGVILGPSEAVSFQKTKCSSKSFF